MKKLNKDEQALVTAFERGELRSVPRAAAMIREAQTAASAYARKDQRVNIRLSGPDLLKIKRHLSPKYYGPGGKYAAINDKDRCEPGTRDGRVR